MGEIIPWLDAAGGMGPGSSSSSEPPHPRQSAPGRPGLRARPAAGRAVLAADPGAGGDVRGGGREAGKAVGNSPCSSSSDGVLCLQKPGKYPPVWATGSLRVPQ